MDRFDLYLALIEAAEGIMKLIRMFIDLKDVLTWSSISFNRSSIAEGFMYNKSPFYVSYPNSQ